jgi:hypothetical protein
MIFNSNPLGLACHHHFCYVWFSPHMQGVLVEECDQNIIEFKMWYRGIRAKEVSTSIVPQ